MNLLLTLRMEQDRVPPNAVFPVTDGRNLTFLQLVKITGPYSVYGLRNPYSAVLCVVYSEVSTIVINGTHIQVNTYSFDLMVSGQILALLIPGLIMLLNQYSTFLKTYLFV